MFIPAVKAYLRLSCLILAAAAAASCATGPQPRLSEQAALQKIQEIEAAGDFQRVAREYNKLAARAAAPKRQEYQLDAAAALVKGNYIRQAGRILNGLTDQELTVSQFVRRQLLLAHISLADHQPDKTLQILAIRLPPDTAAELQAQYHQLRADAYTALDQYLDAANELIEREQHLATPDDIAKNQQAIWRTLLQLPQETLTAGRPSASRVFKGWLALAAIAKAAEQQPVAVDKLISEWRSRYPNHPASKDILDALLARQPGLTPVPSQIALLLPLTGPYAGPAQALQDGFLLAHYSHDEQARIPKIRVYDVGNDAGNIVNDYKRALQDGAQFVVGPLSKEAVQNLVSSAAISVPTLTLNYTKQDDSPAPANLYQFSLSPEDEARQVAERAWLDGHNQALAVIPSGDWGERVFNAFKTHWEALGGVLLEVQTYDPEANDFSAPLQALLDLDKSQARRDALSNLLGQKLNFEPRRRQDADFVFLAAFPRQARLLRPQLEFNYASDLPVYATSHVYTGTTDRDADRDLDGVVFCDMPWVLADGDRRDKMRGTLKRLWPDQMELYKRFYALGIDAYNLIPRLEELKRFPYEEYAGQTGYLTMGQDNRIHRRLLWAHFVDGTARPMDAIMPAQSD